MKAGRSSTSKNHGATSKKTIHPTNPIIDRQQTVETKLSSGTNENRNRREIRERSRDNRREVETSMVR